MHHPPTPGGGQPPAASDSAPASRDAWVKDGFAPLPGDTVRLPGDHPGTVQTVYLCSEPSGDGVTRWTWVVLADGRLLEVAPRGCAIYGAPQVLSRGSGPFLELAAQDGALVRFEERVRAGTWEARPVRLSLGGRRWRLTSTGTVTSQQLGTPPAGGWRQLGTTAPPFSSVPADVARSQVIAPPLPRTGEGVGVRGTTQPDVYFTFAGLTDATVLGLGLWATDIVLTFGRRLGDTPAMAGLRIG